MNVTADLNRGRGHLIIESRQNLPTQGKGLKIDSHRVANSSNCVRVENFLIHLEETKVQGDHQGVTQGMN